MRIGVPFVVLALALAAQSASAQTASDAGTRPVSGAGQTGVDIWSTLYPRPVQSTQVQAQPVTNPSQQPIVTPYQSLGVPVGTIIIYPSVTGATFYDDNVFARTNNRVGDWAAVLRPELAWRSNRWANADVVGNAFVEQRWYRRFNSEDQFNAGIGTGATVQPDANTQLVGRLQYLHSHEDRGLSDNITNTFTNPIRYDQFEAAGAVNKRFDRFWTSLGAAAAWINYGNPTIAGVPISQSYRDGNIIRVPARLGYVVAPLTSVFVEVAGNRRNFEVDAFDSRGWRIVGGMLFEPGSGSRIKGEFFAGYMNQDYTGASLQTVSTWTIGSAMAFLLAPNLTAVVESRRDAREASLSGGVFAGIPGDGVSLIETAVSARADVVVVPNFVLGAGATYVVDEFLLANRTDRSWSPLFSAKYFVNRHLTVGFDYRYLNFDSSGAGITGYYKNVYLFSANLRL